MTVRIFDDGEGVGFLIEGKGFNGYERIGLLALALAKLTEATTSDTETLIREGFNNVARN